MTTTINMDSVKLVLKALNGISEFMQNEYRVHLKKQKVSGLSLLGESSGQEPQHRGYLQGFN